MVSLSPPKELHLRNLHFEHFAGAHGQINASQRNNQRRPPSRLTKAAAKKRPAHDGPRFLG